MVVAANQAMKNSYNQFGDLLGFTVFNNLLKGKLEGFKVAIFAVNDSNCRLLIAGISIFVEECPDTLARILRGFSVIHQKKLPRSLISEDSSAVFEAIVILKREELFQDVAQLVSSWHVLKEYWSKFGGTLGERTQVISQLKQLMITQLSNEAENLQRTLYLSNPNK